ncbi:hypothetical protein C0J52_21239 [Blattella germanica]|nr:hypothetical protein C0J52_21239 [Blattella germanica]
MVFIIGTLVLFGASAIISAISTVSIGRGLNALFNHYEDYEDLRPEEPDSGYSTECEDEDVD